MTGRFKEIFFGRDPAARHSGKWDHYLDVYERHLSRFRGDRITLLEIGVQNGGSIDLFREYFGAELRYVGVDVDPRCKHLEGHYPSGVRIEIGDASDRSFLGALCTQVERIDVVIDDGSHFPAHQRAAFEVLFQHLAADGAYIVEDLHANFFPSYGGSRYSGSSFLAYAKELTDALHDHVYQDPTYVPRLTGRLEKGLSALAKRLGVVAFPPRPRLGNLPPKRHQTVRQRIRSIHFYPYIVVFEKGNPGPIKEVASGSQMLGP